jgi:hypothetical protein
MKLLKSDTFGWIINVLAWIIFIATGEHALEIIMGILCLYAAYIGYSNQNKKLLSSSVFDAVWMFLWGFGIMGDAFGISDFL